MTRPCPSTCSRKCNSRGRNGLVGARVADIRSHTFNQSISQSVSDQVARRDRHSPISDRVGAHGAAIVKVAVVITVAFIGEDSHISFESKRRKQLMAEEIIGDESHISFERGSNSREH